MTATRIRNQSLVAALSFAAAVLVERHLLHRRRNALAADLNLDRRSFRGRPGWNVGGADRHAECRAHRSAPHFPARLTVGEHRVAVPRKGSLACREPDEASL